MSNGSHKPQWSYSKDQGSVGPDEWPKYYQTGNRQSPIDVTVCECLLSSIWFGRKHTCCSDHLAHSLSSASLKDRKRLGVNDEKPRNTHGRKHSDSVNDDSDDQRRSISPASCSSSSHDLSNRNKEQGEEESFAELHVTYPSQKTRYCFTSRKIFIGYPRYISAVPLSNTGHSWQLNIPAELSAHTIICGPPFGDREYRLAQLHCHWSEDAEHGSEHTINGRGFSAEIHFVHWNCSQYDSIEEASRHRHGLAVLGVLVQALDGEQHCNKYLDKIICGLNQVQSPDSSITLHPRLDLKKLLPTNRMLYASYEGSLTTPPLSEVVDWVVFLQPIQCSSKQIKKFSQIKCQTGNLDKNCRPVQPHNGRVISLWNANTKH